MKKLLALLLAMVMAVACFASCGNESASTPDSTTPSESTPDSTPDSTGGSDEPIKGKDYVTIDWENPDADSVNYSKDPLVIEGRPVKKEDAAYTYNLAVNSLPTAWNIHTYQSNDATYILDYTEDGFYTFDYTQDMKGFRIVPAMASDYPIDVTADYIGDKWGIAKEEKGRAYKIPLRSNLKFDNGDSITAADFVESVKLLLNPEAANYRADSVYSGNLKITNAENYFKQGKTVIEDNAATGVIASIDDLVKGADGVYTTKEGKKAWFGVDVKSEWCNGNKLSQYAAYLNADAWNALYAKKNADGYVDITDETIELLGTAIATDDWGETADNFISYIFYEKTYGEMSFNDVGIFADPTDPNALIIVLDKKLTGFYLYYSLNTSMYLVHTDTYKANMSTSQGVYTNAYGTAADKYVGFGPYKLTKYVDANIIEMEKNPYWYGYALAENANNYWTTKITIKQVSSAETRLNMFLAGDLDGYGLQKDDMDDYQQSKYTYYTEGDSTWFIALNPDKTNLETMQSQATPATAGNEVNKTILTIKEFRQALSFSVDRAAYELALDPTGSVAKALFGNMIISDPVTGTAYRNTEEAKDAILEFWGLADEVGVTYETKDEAIAAITGYDLAGAKILFDQAYDKAVADGFISKAAAESGNFEIQIVIGQPGSGSVAYYNDGYELLKKVWTEAVKGTKLEGKLVITQSQPLGSSGFSNYLKNNTVDVLFGVGWTGSALDPYSLMEAYVAPNYQYDPAWDTSATTLDIEIEGMVLRASVYDWGKTALGGDEIEAQVIENGNATNKYVKFNAGTGAKTSIRLKVLAAVEGAVLNQYDMIPVGNEASASLKGMKVKFATEEYVYGVGRGGVKYMTYNYTDAEWAEFVKAQGGTLNYKQAA